MRDSLLFPLPISTDDSKFAEDKVSGCMVGRGEETKERIWEVDRSDIEYGRRREERAMVLTILHSPGPDIVTMSPDAVGVLRPLGLEAPVYHNLPEIYVPLTSKNRAILKKEGYSFRYPGQ